MVDLHSSSRPVTASFAMYSGFSSESVVKSLANLSQMTSDCSLAASTTMDLDPISQKPHTLKAGFKW